MSQPAPAQDESYVLTLEEIGNLAEASGKPAETLTNVVALIAARFQTDVCSVYLLEPDRANLVLAATVAPVVSEARTLDRFIAPAQEKLWALARNMWWSWDQDSTGLFRDLDPV